MKIVIHTQYRENYGAHDWDGTGECPQYWKDKGGSTYVVEGVGIEDAQSEGYYDTLFDLVEESNDYAQEYVLGSDLVDDADFNESNICEHWERPVYIKVEGDKFVASQEHYMEGRPARTWELGEQV